MRNSKFLLGATTFVLAIAGAISSMGHNRIDSKNSRVLTANGNVCVLWTTACTPGHSAFCTTQTLLQRFVYTLGTINNTKCIHPFSKAL